MILSEAASAAAEGLLPRVMMIFAGFWVVVLIVLFLAVGLLLRKHDAASHAQHH